MMAAAISLVLSGMLKKGITTWEAISSRAQAVRSAGQQDRGRGQGGQEQPVRPTPPARPQKEGDGVPPHRGGQRRKQLGQIHQRRREQQPRRGHKGQQHRQGGPQGPPPGPEEEDGVMKNRIMEP